jgi:hypothetical protein
VEKVDIIDKAKKMLHYMTVRRQGWDELFLSYVIMPVFAILHLYFNKEGAIEEYEDNKID